MFDTQLANIWSEARELIKQDISKPSFDTWFKSTELVAYVGDTIIIKTPNDFAKKSLESTYAGLIQQRLEQILNCSLKIQFVTASEKDRSIHTLYTELGYDPVDFQAEENLPPLSVKETASSSQYLASNGTKTDDEPEDTINDFVDLDARYTFETFVIGSNNRFAHAACLAAASEAASNSAKRTYNPLFIYGGAGLGKTHLMRAITYYIKTHNSNVNIRFVTSEKFTNEFIDSIRDNKPNSFRKKYRNVDVLLIDDIQFLSNKEGTQEELFHTFNDLHEANKQIIISSDRPPKEIPTLEERLRTRFEWGLMTDIQPPDLETRTAILRKKAQMDNLTINDDVMIYIAENVKSNIRELEGVLTRVYAFANLSNRPIDLALAQECLQNIIPANTPLIITGDLIQQVVADTYSIKVEEFKAKTRARTVAYPRQIAMYLCREMTDMSLPKIGEIFGGRDHTTVIHAHEKIKNDLKTNTDLQNTISHIKAQLNHK